MIGDEIIICYNCGGTGQICRDIGCHKSEYEYSKCTSCAGSGRLEQTTIVKHVPFIPGGVKAKKLF